MRSCGDPMKLSLLQRPWLQLLRGEQRGHLCRFQQPYSFFRGSIYLQGKLLSRAFQSSESAAAWCLWALTNGESATSTLGKAPARAGSRWLLSRGFSCIFWVTNLHWLTDMGRAAPYIHVLHPALASLPCGLFSTPLYSFR